MRHRFVKDHAYEVQCWGSYHSIEGDGVRLSTAQARHLPIVRRCMMDAGAQHYLGWMDHWLDDARPPLGARRRLDVRPRPFAGAEYFMAVRVADDDEIVGAATVTFPVGEPPQGGVTMRADHRRSGLGRPAARALAALLHRHFGERVIDSCTETVNEGGNRILQSFGAVLVGEAMPWTLPNGRFAPQNVYRWEDPDSRQVCRHRLAPGAMVRAPLRRNRR